MLRQSCVRLEARTSRMFERIFIINLDRRTDRWALVEAEMTRVRDLRRLHTLERVSAVDGRAYSDEVAVRALEATGLLSHLGAKRVLADPSDRVWGMDLTPGAVGCALSHVKLWTRIAAAGAAHAAQHALESTPQPAPSNTPSSPVDVEEPVFLVVEDDSQFTTDFLELYRQFVLSGDQGMSRVPRDWQLLYVGGLDTAHECHALRLPHEPEISKHGQISHDGQTARTEVSRAVCYVPQFHRTTHAYALKPSGARELLARCLPMTYQIDTEMTMRIEKGTRGATSAPAYVRSPRCYTIQPPLVKQRSETDSDIQTTKTAVV